MPPNTTLDTYTDHLDIAAEDVGDVAAAIRTLARLHGVSGELEPIDVFARAASRLADADADADAEAEADADADADADVDLVERLLLGLARRGFITDQQRFALHAIYLRQKA